MNIIAYILYLLLIGMHAVIWKDVTSIFDVVINLPACLVLLVALYKDEVPVTWFGFLAGLVAAAGAPDRMGWYALLMAVLALAGCFVRERLNLDSLKAKLLLVLGGVFVHNVGSLIISGTDGLFILLGTSALTGAVYTTLIAWLFFLFKEGKLTVEKLKSIF
ncbi:MAG: hypothetical protein GY867_04215 [bacterium]|nr:hypothetical protein [bacterium]